jgi:hypothetical protein
MKTNKQTGYIALMMILIVGAAGIAIASALLLTAADSQRSTLVTQQSVQARLVALSCGEEALQRIYEDTTFTVTNSPLSIGQGSCTFTVTNTGGANRTITATATVGTVIRKIQITLTVGATNLTINTWQEVV